MLKNSAVLLRRGKPRPRAGMFPDKYRRVPALLKPQQGGQQYFNEFLIRSANDALEAQQQQQQQQGYNTAFRAGGAGSAAADGVNGDEMSSVHPRLPQADIGGVLQRSRTDTIQAELKQLVAQDGFVSQRGFNERLWYEQEHRRLRAHGNGTEANPSEAATASSSTAEAAAATAEERALPERILGDDYFQSKFGYSLLKEQPPGASMAAGDINTYSQLDWWAEMPKYSRDFVFLYLVSRRRNTYAVAYDYDGKRLLPTYTAGNRGLKGGDRGFRGDGSTDNGHQVTSMYLNDLLPKIREARAASGRPLGRGEKVDLVVRVMGFYNGRQGAVRAVQDRSTDFRVRYLEDVTPFPLNGPKMPRGVFR
ncbi:conserved hypothetical protein [Leishmania braziliensis MHOM/BR/75/M2904]|uniref:Uncharacterized protein n=2 Tax=Leishmania braziliensis TaxID=5660 RepID=A4H478_LEIBR|nr:conserved hypothetical protein [Leishmania braziliensis MHOM/BR/75/M2904]KAI5685309.1 hypothetical protein MNV84_00549 [Leishmania braziliensis]CAJ2466321.1 unnamed protein product [Leishmania braziliensis]CAJ2466931.1 unnamed protein product [Leishmania braziliensis]CAM36867.1 conserved hypothetical protein [Leishmania braziliensis MHOM/BR/75/M2904]SYZ62732.1 hypothetical_protein [Leishmania braziliensis MHOM/BR/75/M2904]